MSGSQLEEFINALNAIQTRDIAATDEEANHATGKYDQLVEYLFRGKGWTVLTDVYTRKIQVCGS